MKLRYSAQATVDLLGIGRYTAEHYGEEQARQYLDQIRSCCDLVANLPLLGRPCAEVRLGLRRVVQGRHVIFYRALESEVKVVRVLHERMLPFKQEFST